MTTERVRPLSSVAIIGLGVIGGSIAKDLAALGVRVLAYDRDAPTLQQACADGCVHERLDESLAGIGQADVVVVAVPSAETCGVLGELARTDCETITDVASTKRGIIDEARRLKIEQRFVGAHPLAGDHRAGWAHAREGMFQNAVTYLCPTAATRSDSLARVHNLWRLLGAQTVELEPQKHDELLAYSSHLPHVAAAAIALVLGHAGVRVTDLGPGGRDVTRIAGASVDMWTSISLENSEALLPAVESLKAHLERVASGLRNRDEQAVRGVFAEARSWTLVSSPRRDRQ